MSARRPTGPAAGAAAAVPRGERARAGSAPAGAPAPDAAAAAEKPGPGTGTPPETGRSGAAKAAAPRPRGAGGGLDALGPARREALRADCARLAALDDTAFGVRLLAHTPTHETRDEEQLRRWATTATAFGTELAAGAGPWGGVPGPKATAPPGAPTRTDGAGRTAARTAAHRPRVVETAGGLDRLLLARYVSRPVPTVELFTDTLALGERLVELLGWRHWYPVGALRAAALAHEEAHCLLHGDTATRRALRDRLGHTALRLGRLRVPGHVAGADELTAHAYASAVCGLGRTPLLLTAALMGAVQALGED